MEKNSPQSSQAYFGQALSCSTKNPASGLLSDTSWTNADSQWLLVRNTYLPLSPALSIDLEISAHIWEIFLTSAFLGSDLLLQNISVAFCFKPNLINLEPALVI